MMKTIFVGYGSIGQKPIVPDIQAVVNSVAFLFFADKKIKVWEALDYGTLQLNPLWLVLVVQSSVASLGHDVLRVGNSISVAPMKRE
jgi:hypothetical protein